MLTHPTHNALTALRLDGMAFVGRSFHWKARGSASPFAELIAEDRGRSLDPVAWIRNSEVVLMQGPPGVGKSQVSIASRVRCHGEVAEAYGFAEVIA
ncbi:hypothetical protein LAZ41_00330, partial [Cereibacter sphaeroides]|nr:hypothetical protein [Cereibacter sphaeroides]